MSSTFHIYFIYLIFILHKFPKCSIANLRNITCASKLNFSYIYLYFVAKRCLPLQLWSRGKWKIFFLLRDHNIRSHMVMSINSNIPNDEPSIYCRGNMFQRIRPFDLNPIYVFH